MGFTTDAGYIPLCATGVLPTMKRLKWKEWLWRRCYPSTKPRYFQYRQMSGLTPDHATSFSHFFSLFSISPPFTNLPSPHQQDQMDPVDPMPPPLGRLR